MSETARLVTPDPLGDWVWNLVRDWQSSLVKEGLGAAGRQCDWDSPALASLGRDVFQLLFQWQPGIIAPAGTVRT